MSDRKFIIIWLSQALASYIVWYFLFGPVIRITFENASKSVSLSYVSIILLIMLVPVWLGQLFTIYWFKRKGIVSQEIWWLTVLFSYVGGVGLAVAWGWLVAKQLAHSKWLLVLEFLIFSVLFYFIYTFLVSYFAHFIFVLFPSLTV